MRIAVVGASRNRMKYGNRAVRAYLRQGHEVFPVNPSVDQVEGLPAYPSVNDIPGGRLDRVLLYVPPEIGIRVLDDIAQREVGEVWVNPGAESDELFRKANALGLRVVYACAIIDVGESPLA
ncbi:MAG: CoA-binding protein [Candidatus Sumerlaeaceae bacterium]|nr:CoA-binding protein [Candidatus Sumerlaeaceae bacterium]